MLNLRIDMRGSLRFWGDWFGRPMDNYHIPTNAGYDERQQVLTICFNGGERCMIYSPKGIVNEPKHFHIQSARKIVWEWNYSGRTPEALYRRVYDWENLDLTMVESRGEQIVRRKRVDPQGSPALEIC